MTGLAGLPVYLDLLHATGLSEMIGRHLQVKQRGWHPYTNMDLYSVGIANW